MDGGMMRIERNGGWLEAWSATAKGPMAARYIYGFVFLLGNCLAWGLRENPKPFFQRQRHSGCHGNRDCFAAEAVLMISFTLFLFFCAMFVTTVCTKNVHDPRHSWHSKRWVEKILLLACCFIFSIFAPTAVTQLYGKVAPIGAGLFVFIQLTSVIRYITRLNSKWCGQANFDNHHRKVNTISKLSYCCSIVGIILLVIWYISPIVNVSLIVTTLALVYGMPVISLLTKAKGWYMEPLLMGPYIVYLCWSAIKSEPETSGYKKGHVNWKTIISFIGGLISATVAACSTGTDYKYIQFMNVVESENDAPYGYGFFHLVFASGSMYFGMLFLGWETHHVSERWSIDVGWVSTIVHLVNEGLAVICFAVVVLARHYRIGWLQQLLAEVFGIGGQQLADESRGSIELPVRSGTTDNNGLPRESPATDNNGESRATEREGSNNRPPAEAQGDPSLATEREGTETHSNGPQRGQGPSAATKRKNAQQTSSSSMTAAGPLGTFTSEPQAPVAVLGRQRGEITEHWL